jgi:hypothetical protein
LKTAVAMAAGSEFIGEVGKNRAIRMAEMAKFAAIRRMARLD